MTTPSARFDELLPAAIALVRRLAHRIAPLREVAAHSQAFQVAQQVARFGLASEVTVGDLRALRTEALRATSSSSGTRAYQVAQTATAELLSIVECDLQLSAIRTVMATDHSDAKSLSSQVAQSLASLRQLAHELDDWSSASDALATDRLVDCV